MGRDERRGQPPLPMRRHRLCSGASGLARRHRARNGRQRVAMGDADQARRTPTTGSTTSGVGRRRSCATRQSLLPASTSRSPGRARSGASWPSSRRNTSLVGSWARSCPTCSCRRMTRPACCSRSSWRAAAGSHRSSRSVTSSWLAGNSSISSGDAVGLGCRHPDETGQRDGGEDGVTTSTPSPGA